jgi:hypothetical protein
MLPAYLTDPSHLAMAKKTLALLLAHALGACASDPNEGVFVVNGVEQQRLTEQRLQSIRQAWTLSSQPKAASTKAGRQASYWILDVIANGESPEEEPCRQLDLIEIRSKEVNMTMPLHVKQGETHFFRAATFHEAWVVSACGRRSEWRVLDDSANPQIPLRVFRLNAG